MPAHAAVDTDGEGQDGLALPVEVHFEGTWKDRGVEIAGGKHAGDAVALLHFDAAHLDVLRDHAAGESHGPTPQQLLDDIVDVVGPGNDLLDARRVLGKPEPDVVERREDGVEPADEQENHEAEDFLVAQGRAARRGVGYAADHALIRMRL